VRQRGTLTTFTKVRLSAGAVWLLSTLGVTVLTAEGGHGSLRLVLGVVALVSGLIWLVGMVANLLKLRPPGHPEYDEEDTTDYETRP